MSGSPSGIDEPAARVSAFLHSLECGVLTPAPGEWTLQLEAAGYRLDIALAVRGPFLRAEAAILPAGLIDPRQLLLWNRQAPLVCFAAEPEGDVFVCGELPLESVESETLDRFLGLLVASAARAREFVTRPSPAAG